MTGTGQLDPVAPGVVRLRQPLGSVWVSSYLIVGPRAALLVDGGIIGLAELVAAALQLHTGPSPLQWIVCTHGHWDHIGGNAEVAKRFGPTVACDDAARPWVEERNFHREQFFCRFPYVLPAQEGMALFEQCTGPGVPVAQVLSEGDVLDLGGGIRTTVIGLPGHGAGGLGLWLDGLLFAGDALAGDGIGRLPAQYESLAAYRTTIERVRDLRPSSVFLGHYDPLEGSRLSAFLDQCAATTERYHALIERLVQQHGTDPRLIVPAFCTELGKPVTPQAAFTVAAHLSHLAAPEEDLNG